ncbi:unnamed protein product [Pseudo-nitzschia multistriata]|uniref:ethanolamine kinase n=1 Tax=Pseudo-nitzschia multistriata TaxID=183589 RepID=A0A448ZA43_9STRA|nr:unnamed protein product [Pseudo-nitzschia multistriata]
MAPSDYVRARKDASESGDECFCALVDGLPYFPNLVVAGAIGERDGAIRGVVSTFLAQQASAEATTHAPPSSWTVAPITGGNTNALYAVSGLFAADGNGNGNGNGNDDGGNGNGAARSSSLPPSVLVRLFGAEGMIDRDAETATYHSLANQGLALGWYGRFGNGRIEELLTGFETLTEADLEGGYPRADRDACAGSNAGTGLALPPENLNQEIARKLAQLHSTCSVPLHLLDDQGATPTPTLWTQLYPWLERSLSATFRNERDTHRAERELDPPLSELGAEIDWLRSEVIGGGGDPGKGVIGFCHNDLLASNIMMKTSAGETPGAAAVLEQLHFIDFEYGGINYYAYDIANHFNEYAGGTAEEDHATPNYDRCPSAAEKRVFLEAYAEEYNRHQEKHNDPSASTTTVDELEASVDGFSLANHLVWGLWGVLQAASEGCEDGLDYLHYAKCRFARYGHDKKLLLEARRRR